MQQEHIIRMSFSLSKAIRELGFQAPEPTNVPVIERELYNAFDKQFDAIIFEALEKAGIPRAEESCNS